MIFLTAIVVGGAAAVVLHFDAQREQVKSVVTTMVKEQEERQNVRRQTRAADAEAKLEQHEREIVSLINRERSQRGIGTLMWDERLQSIARGHSRDMAEKDYFSHTNKSGLDYRARALAAGYRCPNPKWQGVAENLYFGTVSHQTPAAAVTNWLDSPLHKRAMLDPSFRKAAIGVHHGHLSGYGSGYYTTLLLC